MYHENEFALLYETLERCGLNVTRSLPNASVFDVIDKRDISFFEKIFSPGTTLDDVIGVLKPNTLYKFKDSFSLCYYAFLLPKAPMREVAFIGPYLGERLDEPHILELCQENKIDPKYQRSINEFCSILPVLSEYNPIHVFIDSFCERMWGERYDVVDVVSDAPTESAALTK